MLRTGVADGDAGVGSSSLEPTGSLGGAGLLSRSFDRVVRGAGTGVLGSAGASSWDSSSTSASESPSVLTLVSLELRVFLTRGFLKNFSSVSSSEESADGGGVGRLD